MSNTRDKSPELDYYELRRRHEEYKSRARRPAQPVEGQTSEAARPAQEANRPAAEPKAPEIQRKEPVEAPRPRRAGERVQPAEEELPVEEYADPEEDYEDGFDSDAEEAPEEEYENPNPFDSFIRFFHGVKDKLAVRHSKEPVDDEELPEDDYGEDEEEVPAKRRFGRNHAQPDFDAAEYDDLDGEDAGNAEDVADIQEDMRPMHRRAEAARREVDGDLDGEDFDDEDFDGEDFEGEKDHRGGFRKFMRLFVTRVDDADEDEGDEADWDDLEDGGDEPYDAGEPPARPGSNRQVPSDIEGGQEMDEMNKPNSEAMEQLASELESSGMSRRERRERAMRLAAEEAARRAEQEAAAKAAEPAPSQESAPAAAISKEEVAEPAAPAPQIREEVVEEPTREFKPVSMRDVQASAKENLFDIDDEDDEEEDDEDEIKKPRRGLFGKRRARKYEDEDEDEDDLDDDDDLDDEDDEDDEDEDDRPRRGLFGKRRARKYDEDDDEDDLDDEDEDEDDEDDYDDEDEYDEYDDDEDEDDEDEDDEDYDDDDEEDDEHRSFGHHVIGVLKSVLGIIIFLLIVVIVLNFVPAFNGVVDTLNDKFGDSKAFHFLFPGYIARENLAVPDDEPEATVEPTIEPIDVTDVSANSVLPDISNDAAGTGDAAGGDASPAEGGTAIG